MRGNSDEEVAIFTEALGIPAQERDAFLERVCGSDSNLLSRIAALLRAHDRVGDFLEEPPTGGPSSESN